MERTTCIAEERVVKKKTIYPPLNAGSGADLRYTEDVRSDTENDRRGKKYCQKKKCDKSSRGGKSEEKK